MGGAYVIVSEMSSSEEVDPSVALRFSEYFLKNQQFEKAVTMLINAKERRKALKICMQFKVTITDEMAEKLSPPKPMGKENPNYEREKEERREILMFLAKCLREQKSYQLACKKYVQAGDKMKAIKCLIKAGDVQKVIYFAS